MRRICSCFSMVAIETSMAVTRSGLAARASISRARASTEPAAPSRAMASRLAASSGATSCAAARASSILARTSATCSRAMAACSSGTSSALRPRKMASAAAPRSRRVGRDELQPAERTAQRLADAVVEAHGLGAGGIGWLPGRGIDEAGAVRQQQAAIGRLLQLAVLQRLQHRQGARIAERAELVDRGGDVAEAAGQAGQRAGEGVLRAGRQAPAAAGRECGE